MPVGRAVSLARTGGSALAGFKAVSGTYGALFLSETVLGLLRGEGGDKPFASRVALVALKIIARDSRVLIAGTALEQGIFSIIGSDGEDDAAQAATGNLEGEVAPMWQRDP